MPNGVIPHGGLTLWRITPAEAPNHPYGATHAGLLRTPDGQLFGLHAHFTEVNGRTTLEGGAYVAEIDTVEQPAEELYAQPIGVPPRPPKVKRQALPCADFGPGQSRAVPPGKLAAPQADLLAASIHEFDDSGVLEGLPL